MNIFIEIYWYNCAFEYELCASHHGLGRVLVIVCRRLVKVYTVDTSLECAKQTVRKVAGG